MNKITEDLERMERLQELFEQSPSYVNKNIQEEHYDGTKQSKEEEREEK